MSNLFFVFFYTFRATFISCCVLVHQWLPGAVSHVIFSEMCLLFSVFFFCFAFSQHFVCLSCCISIFFPHPFSLLCMMMAVALLIMSCPPSLIRWETLSQLHLLCSLSSSLIFSFLSRFCFPFLSLLHHLLSPLFDDGCRFISFWYLRGFRACDARGPRGQWAKPNLPNEVLIKLIMGN